MGRRVNPRLFAAQRITAFILAFAVAVHLVTILFVIRGGLNAGEILARTRGNIPFMAFYATFVVAVAIHAPIGLRNVLREWTPWRGRTLDIALFLFALLLFTLGFRAVYAVYAA